MENISFFNFYLLVTERYHCPVVPPIHALIGYFLCVSWPEMELTMLVYRDNCLTPELAGQGENIS